MAVSKQELLKACFPEADVELSRGVVRVRGLSRGEVKHIGEQVNAGKDMEAYSLSLALLEPTLTQDEAEQFLAVVSFDDAEKLSDKINELSGIKGRADKESPEKRAYKSDGGEPGPGV